MHLPLTMMKHKYARLVLLVKDGVNVKIHNNLMHEDLAVIWLSVLSGGKNVLKLGGLYREHQHLLMPKPNPSKSDQAQLDRWNLILAGWKRAASSKNCMLIGDTNIDYARWHNPDGAHLRCPQRLISQQNELRGSSDHNMISVILRTKDTISSPQVIRKRLWKKFCLSNYREEIKLIDWSPLTDSTDVNFMNNYFEQKLSEVLENFAPMCNIQIRIFFRNWLDGDCKDLMLIRDKQRELAKKSDLPEDWSHYRKLRNECTKKLKKIKN